MSLSVDVPERMRDPRWASARAREETGGKGGEGRENLMQHRMCIVGSKAKTEGSSLRDYWYRASLDSSGPVTCQAQGRGAARLGGQGGARFFSHEIAIFRIAKKCLKRVEMGRI